MAYSGGASSRGGLRGRAYGGSGYRIRRFAGSAAGRASRPAQCGVLGVALDEGAVAEIGGHCHTDGAKEAVLDRLVHLIASGLGWVSWRGTVLGGYRGGSKWLVLVAGY